MKISKLSLLVVAAAALVGLALWSSKSNAPRKPEQVGRPILPGLDVNAIARIEINQADKTVALANDNDRWVVQSLFNYPADFSKIRGSLLTLRELKIGVVERGASLGTSPTLVDLQDKSGRSLASLRLGDIRHNTNNEYGYSTPDGRAVSGCGSDGDTVFLVKESLNTLVPDPKSWIETEITSLQSSEIDTIALSGPEGDFILDRSSGKLALTDLTDGEAFDSAKSYGTESALSYLRFNDLADPTLDDETTGISTGHTYTVTTKDGTIYTASIGNPAANNSDRYFRLAVSAVPVSTNAAIRAEVTKKALDLNAKVSPWLYLISSYTADNMSRTRDQFVKPAEAKAEADAEAESETEATAEPTTSETAAEETTTPTADSTPPTPHPATEPVAEEAAAATTPDTP